MTEAGCASSATRLPSSGRAQVGFREQAVDAELHARLRCRNLDGEASRVVEVGLARRCASAQYERRPPVSSITAANPACHGSGGSPAIEHRRVEDRHRLANPQGAGGLVRHRPLAMPAAVGRRNRKPPTSPTATNRIPHRPRRPLAGGTFRSRWSSTGHPPGPCRQRRARAFRPAGRSASAAGARRHRFSMILASTPRLRRLGGRRRMAGQTVRCQCHSPAAWHARRPPRHDPISSPPCCACSTSAATSTR